MTTRAPLQPVSPPSANIINTRYTHLHTAIKSTNGIITMQEQVQEDTQEIGSVVSGLSSLENDADEFERLMIQNARDERRLNEARHGRVQAFRKARTHPRVGLTIDNLERNNARNEAASAPPNAHVNFESPPSSSGSACSDPAIHAPASWGRKGRSNRNWMRTITYEEEQLRTPVAADYATNGHYNHPHQQPDHDANEPRRSIEDSPLSHKSSIHGTPRNDHSAEWDLTFELNEASMIASTPYIPRNTALDDIRQREIESLKEQVVATARPDRMRDGSPEQTRRPRSSSAKSTNSTINVAQVDKQARQGADSPEKRLHTRTKSWQSIEKSQPVTGTGKENSQVAMYKSAENIAAVEHEAMASAQISPPKRTTYRREDSQDLLRRLARVSNTPSPGRVAASRPQTAPAKPPNSSSQTALEDTTATPSDTKQQSVEEPAAPETLPEPSPVVVETQSQDEAPRDQANHLKNPPQPPPAPETEDIDATPAPVERSILNPKTPVVTGAWIDTPGPRTTRKIDLRSRSPSKSPKASPQKNRSPRRKAPSEANQPSEAVIANPIRPTLPTSALQALVEEAKANKRRPSADFGDSTINSLEELITPSPESPEGENEEDTLQGIQLPTSVPRNEAERRRQQEAEQLHRMNDRLRAARTSIRHASRGMQRVEERVELVEEDVDGVRVRVINHAYPYEFSMWTWFKSCFWHEPLKVKRLKSGSRWKILGGLTWLSLFLILFFTWFTSENVLCDLYCHPEYAPFSRYPYSVNPDAPEFPFVIPTLIYRKLIKAWWLPLYSLLSWIGTVASNIMFGVDDTRSQTASQAVRDQLHHTATVQNHWASSMHVAEEMDWDLSMNNDQAV